MYYPSLTNDELVRTVEYGPTGTDLERELAKRLGEFLLHEKDIEALSEYDLEAEDIQAIGPALLLSTENTVATLRTLSDAEIYDAETLGKELELAAKFRELSDDAGDIFSRLIDLTELTN